MSLLTIITGDKEDKEKEEKAIVLRRLSKLTLRIEKGMTDMSPKLFQDEKGMSSIEYAMMVVFIACVVILGMELLGLSTKSLLEVANSLLPFGDK